MLTLSAVVNGNCHVVTLPHPRDWAVNAERQHASRTALAGNVIHQTAMKDVSAARPTFEGPVPEAQALVLRQLDQLTAIGYLADGEHLYESVFDAQVTPSDIVGCMQVRITFFIIREVL